MPFPVEPDRERVQALLRRHRQHIIIGQEDDHDQQLFLWRKSWRIQRGHLIVPQCQRCCFSIVPFHPSCIDASQRAAILVIDICGVPCVKLCFAQNRKETRCTPKLKPALHHVCLYQIRYQWCCQLVLAGVMAPLIMSVDYIPIMLFFGYSQHQHLLIRRLHFFNAN